MTYRWARCYFAQRRRLVAACLCLPWLLVAVACEEHREPPPPSAQERSPNASILPAPLASTNDLLGSPKLAPNATESSEVISSGGAPGARLEAHPIPIPAPLNPLRPLVDRDVRVKDPLIFSLEATWRWPEIELGPLEPEADLAAIEAERKRTAPKITLDISANGRLRWVWATSAFSLPSSSELRARYDTFGHVLLWPKANKYRLLSEGTLKAVLSERRADTSPLVSGTVRSREGQTRLGYPSYFSDLTLPSGETLLLEQIKLEELELGAPLLCRLLVELIGIKPSSEACDVGLLPVYAEFRWAGGGSAVFEVTSLVRKTELNPRLLLAPPPGAGFEVSGLPEASGMISDAAGLRALHSRDRLTKKTESRGLNAANFSAAIAYLVLDRARVAWVLPSRTVELVDLRPGRYHAAWHDFFGRLLMPATIVEVPDRLVVGAALTGPQPASP